MKKILLSIISILILLTSCSTIKTVKLMKSGEVEQEVFNVQIPFEYRLGLIILKVNIAGKEYDFLLDTGAPNAVSKKLAKELNLTPIFSEVVTDSNGANSEVGLVKWDHVSIGGVKFLNTGAVIVDLELSKEVGCLNIDGLIGSNLMRKAVWKFDYENQIITITNSTESLDIPSSAQKIPFKEDLAGIPTTNVTIGGATQKDVTIDLGSNGVIALEKKSFNASIKNNQSS